MVEITDEDIDLLIHHYKGQKVEKEPVYNLKDLIKSGMMFVYGDRHFANGKIIPCNQPFTLYNRHVCHGTPITREPSVLTKKNTFLEVPEIKQLEKTSDTMISCWAGYNLAVLTSSFELQAYFKRGASFPASIL